MSSDLPADQTANRDQVLRLIDYLAEYDAQRNKPVRNIADYKLFRLNAPDLPTDPAVRLPASEDAWLVVDFVDLPAAPAVPDELEGTLDEGRPLSADTRPAFTVEAPEPPADRPGGPIPDEDETAYEQASRDYEEAISAYKDLAQSAETWIEQAWTPWSQQYKAARAVKSLHRELFEQRERLLTDRESVELVWGFGRARWNTEGYTVDHPLATVPVEVDLDPKTQRISVHESGLVTVEVSYLAGLDVHDRQSLLSIRTSVADDEFDPWDAVQRTEILRRITRAVDDEGTVGDTPSGTHLSVADTWTLYLRRRVPDSQSFLAKMREIYLEGGTIPAPLLEVVEDAEDRLPDGSEDGAQSATIPPEPFLLPLPANDEQRRILELAGHLPGVTVQGPPGTGKSHTIANLISHYVAYGKRVLVVSEKEQALRVLAEKVPEGIRDLTVSVLGADTESRKSLEKSVGTIQQRVGLLDVVAADGEIGRLRIDLDVTDRGLAEATTDMLRAREAEVQEAPGEWLAGTDPTPQSAAVWVRAHQDTLAFIPDRLGLATPLPITATEFAELVRLLGSVEARDAQAALTKVPNPAEFPTEAELGRLLDLAADGDAAANAVRPAFADWQLFAAADRKRIVAARETVLAYAGKVEELAGSPYENLLGRLDDALVRTELEQYAAALESLREQAMAHRRALMLHSVELAGPAFPEALGTLQQAKSRLEVSGKLGIFDGKLKKALAAYTVDGQPAQTAEHAALAIEAVSLELIRAQLVRVHHNQSPTGGGRVLSVRPEDDIAEEIAAFGALIALPKAKFFAQTELYELGVRYDRLTVTDPAPARAAAADLATALKHFEAADARARLGEVESELKAGSVQPEASPLWLKLIEALQSGDRAAWASLQDEAGRLVALLEPARRLRELRTRLAAVVPQWADALERDPAAAPPPDRIEAGWQWRQLDCWISGIADLPTPAELQQRVDELGRNRRRIVSDLVEQLAWRRLKGNLGPKQQQALQAYVQSVRRYGKTGGKYAARWTQEMRSALNDSADAVPVWVMTTSRALMSFQPTAQPQFDVLIIDEASQIGFEALPLLALAKRAIIVGDDKQTSPENVGLDRQRVFDIMDDHLTSLHGYKSLFDPDNSLYDLAAQKFSSPVMLSEHFRCLPEIIAFSSALSYNNRIVPLRDEAPHPGWAPLGVVRVKDGYRVGDLNVPEAEQVVALVKELIADPAYEGMTFGVISLLGSTQSKYIWDRLYEELGTEVFEQRAIRCGEAAGFQGDERDVIIVSTVVALDPGAASTRFSAMTKETDRRRINVTASRARNQMWVVTSVDPAMLPAGDFRAGLIQHCAGYAAEHATQEQILAACESEFERRVVTDLITRGYTGVEVQRKVGQYRLDIVVSGPERRLTIECDGDRWHGPDVWHQDRARQEVLERAGWTFERIRGSAYFRDPLAAMEPVWAHLEELGIPTGDAWQSATARTMVREVSGLPAVLGAEDPVAAEPTATEPIDAELVAAVPAHDGGWVADRVQVPEALPAAATAVPAAESPDAEAVSDEEFDDFLAGLDADAADDEDEADTEGEDLSDSPSSVSTGLIRLLPYTKWSGLTLSPVTMGNLREVEAGLIEIVRVEGPMIARQAYLRYQQATGGSRVGKALQSTLNKAVARALRAGSLARIDDQIAGVVGATLFAPGHEPVVLRELGPRTIFDVPKSEIVTAFELLLDHGVDREDLNRLIVIPGVGGA